MDKVASTPRPKLLNLVPCKIKYFDLTCTTLAVDENSYQLQQVLKPKTLARLQESTCAPANFQRQQCTATNALTKSPRKTWRKETLNCVLAQTTTTHHAPRKLKNKKATRLSEPSLKCKLQAPSTFCEAPAPPTRPQDANPPAHLAEGRKIFPDPLHEGCG